MAAWGLSVLMAKQLDLVLNGGFEGLLLGVVAHLLLSRLAAVRTAGRTIPAD